MGVSSNILFIIHLDQAESRWTKFTNILQQDSVLAPVKCIHTKTKSWKFIYAYCLAIGYKIEFSYYTESHVTNNVILR